MRVASLGFATDLLVRRMEGSSVLDKGDHMVVRTPANPGFYWGNFVLAGTDLDDHERWLGVFAREFPDSRHVAIGLDGAERSGGALAGYLAAGLEADVSQVLCTMAIDAPASHPDVGCRLLDSNEDWAQILDLDLDCAERIDEDHGLFLRRRAAQRREMSRRGRAVWFGAPVDGRVRASLGLVSDGHGLVRYQDVQTHPGFRRRGLARALVATAGRYGLDELRAQTLVILADPSYHAINLYRSLGFADADTHIQLQKQPPHS